MWPHLWLLRHKQQLVMGLAPLDTGTNEGAVGCISCILELYHFITSHSADLHLRLKQCRPYLYSPVPLQRALGPPAPEGYINIIMAMEDVILRREWDVSFGAVFVVTHPSVWSASL